MHKIDQPFSFVSRFHADKVALLFRSAIPDGYDAPKAFSFKEHPGFGFRGTHGVRVEQISDVDAGGPIFAAMTEAIAQSIHEDDLLHFDIVDTSEKHTSTSYLISKGQNNKLPYADA